MVLMSVQRRLYNSYLEVENDCLAFLDFPRHDNIVPPLDIVDLHAVYCSFPDKILTRY